MTEQPNTELLIVKTIQGLMTCISNELEKLSPSNLTTYTVEVGKKRLLIADAIEVIASFEKNELYELQKAFE